MRDNERLVGAPAQRQAVTNPQNTISSAKRFIGHNYDELTKETKNVSFTLKKGKDGGVMIELDGEERRPEEISAMVLQKIKADAESYLGEEVKEAVITVPAYFDDSQRQATKDAGKIAGLEVKRIINEPTAAALAYGLDKNKDQKVAIYDFGGGTFDISILEISEDGTFEVMATNGDTQLGGDDFDRLIIDHLAEQFKKDEGIDLKKDPMALQRLKDEAEKAKKELSSGQQVNVNIPYVTADQSGPKHLNITMTRAEYEKIIAPHVDRSFEPCKKVLKDAGVEAKDIDEVILVGGTTRTPMIQEKVKEFFGKDPHKGINPDEVVALGAAIQAGVLMGDVKDVLLLDVSPLTLSIETMGGIATPVIERNTTIPTKKSQVFSTAADNQSSVEINVVQGEREMATDNKSLGKFILDGIPPAPRGTPQIEVTFDIDANGILTVTAEDKGTGKKQHITIEGSSNLSEDEINKMQEDAEKHAEEDKQKKESVETRNMLDSAVFQAEKSLEDVGDKISEDTKKAIEDKVAESKKVLENGEASKEELESAQKELMEVLQKSGEEIYKAQSEENSEPSDEEKEQKDDQEKQDESVDAEVVDEENKDDDEKKDK